MTERLRATIIEAAVIVVAVIEGALTAIGEEPSESLVLCLIAVLAVLVRERWPLVSFVATLPAVVFPGAIVAALAALYTVAARYRSWWLLTGCWLVTAGTLAFPLLDVAPQFWHTEMLLGVIYFTMTAGAPILLGRFLHSRRELALRLNEVKEAREHERRLDAQAVLAKERNQLAREMHDVVSHQVSLIAVQAGAMKVSTTDPASKAAAENIRQLSVNTLDELRHMVNLLRASGTPATELTPQPTLTDLHRLIAGSAIDARLVGDAPEDLEPPLQRAIYRTIQEALTNVRKHAPGAGVTIDLSREDTDLTVTVTNTRPTRPTLALPSARHGLVGLQERAALLGGRLHAGSMPDGGFRLRLWLPLAVHGGHGPK
ncbi:sensor histidine kinase [Amycolatopsis keratiniphila]|uniref:sensor histidine kinase n=1 Tax=Amycolatopsis keratiniphila TaxID=129921 RepID=UPI00087B1EDE|nr:histidine kinase [Amycolatopsis keratiniphila]OLZ49918.1 two-component sensor histidine kinase [Amycolatopsis keratiniphila subsp. nogabecina]SDU25949.1 Signal transduction histidine kinase [Amycolatopsis keratiniphila]